MSCSAPGIPLVGLSETGAVSLLEDRYYLQVHQDNHHEVPAGSFAVPDT